MCETLFKFSSNTEVYSIDEVFLSFEGMQKNYNFDDYGREIKKTVLKSTHIPVGVGISTTKTLAKLANKAAKTWTKTGGVVDLSSPERQRKLLPYIDVSDVWGGPEICHQTEQHGHQDCSRSGQCANIAYP